MKYRKHSSRFLWICWLLFGIEIIGMFLLGIIGCIGMPHAWPVLFIPLVFLLGHWLLGKILIIIEFYEDKLVFKRLYGKVLKVVPKKDIRAICYAQEDMTLRGFLFRYYVFDIPGERTWQGSRYKMECNSKNESFLKEFFPDLKKKKSKM